MSAACKDNPEDTARLRCNRLGPANGRQPSPACSTRGGIGRLCCDGIRLVAKPQRKPQTFPEVGFQRPPAPPADTRAAPRGEAVHCLARIAIRPLASGQPRTVTGQLRSNPIRQAESSQVVRAGARHEAVFIANCAARRHFWVCGLARSKRYSAHPKWPRGPQCRSGWPEGVRGVSLGELDVLGVDRQGRLYWDGIPVQGSGHSTRHVQRGGEASP
jgi:hypothetical protein